MGEFLKIKHSDLFVIEPSSKTNFNLHCKVSSNTLAKCSKIHYRWVENGAYKPDGDGKTVLIIALNICNKFKKKTTSCYNVFPLFINSLFFYPEYFSRF